MPYRDPSARLEYFRAWQNKNRLRVREYNRQYRLRNPNKVRRMIRSWYLRNPDKVRAAKERFNNANPNYAAKATSRYRQRHRTRYLLNHREHTRRRTALKNTNGPVEKVDYLFIWVRDRGICGICGSPTEFGSFHVDHIIPLSRGGPHTAANVQIAHPSCNLAKGSKQ